MHEICILTCPSKLLVNINLYEDFVLYLMFNLVTFLLNVFAP